MKALLLISILIIPPAAGYAQGFELANGTYIPDVVVRTVIIVLMFYIASSFLLTLIRMLLGYSLKSKMIDRGIMGPEAEKILRTDTENKDYAVKWFLLLLGAGAGLTVTGAFPLGWLSVGILAFSLSLSFAGYYFYLKEKNRKL